MHRKWEKPYKMEERFKRRPHPGMLLFFGMLLILVSGLFLAYELHWISSGNWLAIGLIGLGVILLVTGIISSSSGHVYMPMGIIAGAALLCYGVASLLGISNWWPLALLVVGLALLFMYFFLQKEAKKHRRVEETLHASEVKYGYIIDNANSIIMEVDPTGKITFMNRYARGFFGFGADEIPGKSMVGTIVPDTEDAVQKQEDMLKDITERPESYLNKETENTLYDGRQVWIAWSCRPVMGEENNLKQIMCIGIDRTEQKKADDIAALQMSERTAAEERNRLARDLHDAVSQTLFSASLIADVLPRIWGRDQNEGLKRLEEMRQLTRGSLAEMRTLLFELKPTALVDAELGDLLRQLAEAIKGRARLPVTVDIQGKCEIPVEVKVALYRIAQEALNNMAKHSGASCGQVALQCLPQGIVLSISDNGQGFDKSLSAFNGFGLGNMKERAEKIGASLLIDSRIDNGTSITVTWPGNSGEMKQ